MKKQELFIWKYDKNITPGCIEQLENYIQDLLKNYIVNHQIITEISNSGRNYILGMNFIVTKL